MRLGVFDVIPRGSLDSLTAEDFRLLINGVGDINVQTLISYTSFNDESGNETLLLHFALKIYLHFEEVYGCVCGRIIKDARHLVKTDTAETRFYALIICICEVIEDILK